jgi:hypothetical protein
VFVDTSPNELLDIANPQLLADEDIGRIVRVLQAEAQRRAVERADPAALVEDAFQKGFLSTGMPRDPWVINGILVAPGAKLDKSVMSHRCSFVRLDSHWIWEHPDMLEDSIRHLPGPQSRMQSVSLVPLVEAAAIDVVEARTRQGVHELVAVRSFTYEDGVLVLVSQRSVGRVTHR